MDDIMQVLEDDHKNMRALMGLLESEIDKLADGGHADIHLISAIVEYLLEYPDRFHHPVEDMIAEAMRATGAVPLMAADTLNAEHAKISALVRELDDAASAIASEQPMRRDIFVACARSYIAVLRQHMDAEDKEFFPRARESLSTEDRAALFDRLPGFEDPLFGTATRERYHDLSAALLAR